MGILCHITIEILVLLLIIYVILVILVHEVTHRSLAVTYWCATVACIRCIDYKRIIEVFRELLRNTLVLPLLRMSINFQSIVLIGTEYVTAQNLFLCMNGIQILFILLLNLWLL